MIVIDIEHKLDEKKSKELLYSINQMITYTFKTLHEKALQEKLFDDFLGLKLHFDNKNEFYISTICNGKSFNDDFGYLDKRGQYKDSLTLQEALNINKYALDIEFKLKQSLDQPQTVIDTYYTEQNIDARLPIFNEDDVRARFIKPGTEPCEYVTPANVFVPIRTFNDHDDR